LTPKDKALALAEAAHEKKALDVRVLDVRGVASFTDFFVIASGNSHRHVGTIADGVLERARALGERPMGVEGQEVGRWVLVDLGNVILHVFQEETRAYYELERLWGEAEFVELELVAGEAS
jgi:ribosome-associated protein